MGEQVNIPALGTVCVSIRVSTVRALYGYTSRKGEVKSSEATKSC